MASNICQHHFLKISSLTKTIDLLLESFPATQFRCRILNWYLVGAIALNQCFISFHFSILTSDLVLDALRLAFRKKSGLTRDHLVDWAFLFRFLFLCLPGLQGYLMIFQLDLLVLLLFRSFLYCYAKKILNY